MNPDSLNKVAALNPFPSLSSAHDTMKKQTAIELLGGSRQQAALRLRLTSSAFAAWPDTLTRAQADRVIGALVRLEWAAHLTETRLKREHLPHPLRDALSDD